MVENDLKEFGVETRIVIANFSGSHNMAFYDAIVDQIKDIDVGFVVLNAGVSNSGYFAITESTKLQEMLDANVYHVGALAFKMKTRLEKRNKRSGIVIVASVAA